MSHQKILGIAVCLAALAATAAFATPPASCDSAAEAQVAVMYSGATSINTTLNNAIAALCIEDTDGDGTKGVTSEGGAPGQATADYVRRTCGTGGVNQTFLCRMDLNGDGSADTCVAYYIHNQAGSCEGLDQMDVDGSADVCNIDTGAVVASGTIADPSAGKGGTTCAVGKKVTVEHNGSDVSADNCLPPPVNSMLETRVAVEPFTYIVDQDLLTSLSAGTKIRDLYFTQDSAQGVWGTRDICDWQIVDARVTAPVAISAVKRNPKSGTRRSNDKTVLKNVLVSPDILETSGTGAMITAVNGNSVPSPFNCAISGHPTVAAGYIGVDKFNINDNGTPTNKLDDFPVRASGTGNCDRGTGGDCYEAIGYNGPVFNPERVRCGLYQWWTYMRFHRRSSGLCDSAKATVENKVETSFTNIANLDKGLIGLNDMVVKRDTDGGLIKPIPGATQCTP